jgi:hypothetical protein
MIYKVTVNNNNKKIKAVVKSGVIMARRLDELLDVDLSGVGDKYVLMYDSTTKKYKAVNPDAILSAASTTETTQPGLPSDFKNQLDTDLDNKIDLDGGSF